MIELLRSRELRMGLTDERIDELLRDHDRDGFGYRDYANQDGYGISLSSPSWVWRQLEQSPGLRVLSYTERGWWGLHDTVAALREG